MAYTTHDDAFFSAVSTLREAQRQNIIDLEINAAAGGQPVGANAAHLSQIFAAASLGSLSTREQDKKKEKDAQAQLLIILSQLEAIDMRIAELDEQINAADQLLALHRQGLLDPENEDHQNMARNAGYDLNDYRDDPSSLADHINRLKDRRDDLVEERNDIANHVGKLEAQAQAGDLQAIQDIHERSEAAMDIEQERRSTEAKLAELENNNEGLSDIQRAELQNVMEGINLIYEHIKDPDIVKTELENLISGVKDPIVLDALSEQESRQEAAEIVYSALANEPTKHSEIDQIDKQPALTVNDTAPQAFVAPGLG